MNEEKKPADVPYIVHEEALARSERHIKRLWILCIIIFVALVLTNIGWIWYESQWEDVVMTQEAATDSGGNVSINGVAVGDINNDGEGKTDNKSQAP